ncbi:MAG: hypothetical protein V1729_06565 [Candidatus Woesearchaeota archaeon]
MNLKDFQSTLIEIKGKVESVSKQSFDLKKVVENGSYMYDYKHNKAKYAADQIKRKAKVLVEKIEQIHKANKNPRLDELIVRTVLNSNLVLEKYLEPKECILLIGQIEKDLEAIDKIHALEKEISDFEKEAAVKPSKRSDKLGGGVRLNFELPELPEEIEENIQADVEELKNCYGAKCYRSSIILCGRIIETALHRKYFEVTGNDALEKEPGIGLGKLIARMSEKGIRLDPALPQQIQFINQVRIFSVHTKQQAFNPSDNQAQATVLYTMDVLGKLFASE